MRKSVVDKLVQQYLDNGGKITKLRIGQTSDSDKADEMNMIDVDLPEGFNSPEMIIKDELKDIL